MHQCSYRNSFLCYAFCHWVKRKKGRGTFAPRPHAMCSMSQTDGDEYPSRYPIHLVMLWNFMMHLPLDGSNTGECRGHAATTPTPVICRRRRPPVPLTRQKAQPADICIVPCFPLPILSSHIFFFARGRPIPPLHHHSIIFFLYLSIG